MSPTAIKDIYAGMPDAKDEISTNQISAFLQPSYYSDPNEANFCCKP